jgi:hypothetical protein
LRGGIIAAGHESSCFRVRITFLSVTKCSSRVSFL